MKVAIIGADAPRTTLIEELVKAVEEKYGEKVEFVNIHAKDREFLSQQIPIKQPEPFILRTIERSYDNIDIPRKSHKRPYKYHP